MDGTAYEYHEGLDYLHDKLEGRIHCPICTLNTNQELQEYSLNSDMTVTVDIYCTECDTRYNIELNLDKMGRITWME